jgi:probable phosphoglycerate mutase
VSRALLVRHAEHALLDQVLVGRMPGVSLTTRGRERARILARTLRRETIVLVQSSPRERCLETAEEICRALDLPCAIEHALDEIDFGAWNGARFAALENDPGWHSWNGMRSHARPPGGESMQEAQLRIVQHIGATERRIAGAVVMVTHAEIIRAALLHERNLPLDSWSMISVAPGSISELRDSGATCARAGVRSAAA